MLLQYDFRDFLLFELGFYKFKNVGVVGIHYNHSGGSSSSAARFDSSRHFVPAAVERKRARSRPLARYGLALASDRRNVDANPRAACEDAAFGVLMAQNRLHRVFYAQNKASGGLRIFGGIRRLYRVDSSVFVFRAIVGLRALAFQDFSQVGPAPAPLLPVAYVEPYGAVWRPHLVQEHVLHFLVEIQGAFLAVEIPQLIAPDSVGVCYSVENIFYGILIFGSARLLAENVAAKRDFQGVVAPVRGHFHILARERDFAAREHFYVFSHPIGCVVGPNAFFCEVPANFKPCLCGALAKLQSHIAVYCYFCHFYFAFLELKTLKTGIRDVKKTRQKFCLSARKVFPFSIHSKDLSRFCQII